MRRLIFSDKTPRPIGPYSQAVECKGMLYCSGQLGIDPVTGKMVDGGVEAETRQCLENLSHVVAAAGGRLDNAVRCGIFVTDMEDFGKVNAVYAGYFKEKPPARTTVQVARLPLGGKVEIDVIVEL